MELKVTKKQKELGSYMIAKIVSEGSYTIQNPTEHKIAEMLIKAGAAKIIKKKNYGRIDVIG